MNNETLDGMTSAQASLYDATRALMAVQTDDLSEDNQVKLAIAHAQIHMIESFGCVLEDAANTIAEAIRETVQVD